MINIVHITFHSEDGKIMQEFRHGVFLHSNLPMVVPSAMFITEYKDQFNELFPNESDEFLFCLFGMCPVEGWDNIIRILKSLNLKRPECFSFHCVEWEPSITVTGRRFKSTLVDFDSLDMLL